MICRFDLNVDDIVFQFSMRVVGIEKQVYAVIVLNALDGVTAA